MKYFGTVAASILCLTLMFSSGYAQEKKEEPVVEQQKTEAPPGVTGTATLGVFNKYVFRGYELSRSSIVFEPAITASYEGFSASVWGNIDSKEHATQNFVPDREGRRSFNETDITLSYTKTLGKLSLTGGYIYYGTKYADETQEVFGTVGYDMIGKPTLSIYRDFDRYPGTYFNLSFGHSIKLGADITLDLGAAFGYMWGDGSYWKTFQSSTGDYTGSKYAAPHDGIVKAGLTIPITKRVSLVPQVQYWFPLSDKAKKRIDGTSYNINGYLGTNFVGGANITFSF